MGEIARASSDCKTGTELELELGLQWLLTPGVRLAEEPEKNRGVGVLIGIALWDLELKNSEACHGLGIRGSGA
jgi:hypothetical protein